MATGYVPARILGIKGVCTYCGIDCVPSRDHFYPKSRGGKTKVWSCRKCNTMKANLLPEKWIEKVRSMKEHNKHIREKIIQTTYRLISEIPVEIRNFDKDLLETQNTIDLRKQLNIDKQRSNKKVRERKVNLTPGCVQCKCGVEKRTTWVNGYKMVRYWKEGNYLGNTNRVACMPCMFT